MREREKTKRGHSGGEIKERRREGAEIKEGRREGGEMKEGNGREGKKGERRTPSLQTLYGGGSSVAVVRQPCSLGWSLTPALAVSLCLSLSFSIFLSLCRSFWTKPGVLVTWIFCFVSSFFLCVVFFLSLCLSLPLSPSLVRYCFSHSFGLVFKRSLVLFLFLGFHLLVI